MSSVRAADGEVPVWDPNVRFFRVPTTSGQEIAAFYLDPYSRPENKRGGAWMDGALRRKRRADGTVRLPVAYLVCNMTPPVARQARADDLPRGRDAVPRVRSRPAAHADHASTTSRPPASTTSSGTRSSSRASSWRTGATRQTPWARSPSTSRPASRCPRSSFDKIVAARTYRAGSATLRQVYFATLDLALHSAIGLHERVLELQRRVAAENTVIPPLPEDRFLCSFSHIFAGGYAAGYYSYKWAEVLSADAFSALQEAGLDEPSAVRETGRRFRRTVLALGGSRHPMEVFEEFRGRPPSTRPLLEQTGLLG